MKTLRRILLALLVIVVALAVIPFLIPLDESGIDPAQLVDDPDGAFYTVQGVRLYVEDKGDADAPAVFLLHGLFGSTEVWRNNVDALVDAGFRVVAFDRPGFGLSDKIETFDYSVGNQADLTAQLMDALGIESAAIIGHSAGGNVAAHFAVRHPDRVARLVLVDAAVLAGGPPPFAGGIVSLPPVWRWGRIGLRAFFTRDNLERSLGGFYVDPSFLSEADYDAYARVLLTPRWEVGLLALTRDSGGNLLGEERVRTISASTLILWGDQDTVTPLRDGERLAQLIAGSRLEIIADAGHQPFEEAAERFNAALIAYLAE
jgi:pimeloyl-ACP methyl ester carboxylesterase